MSRISIQLLGRFSIQRDGQPLDGFESHKVQELFCYLLLHRNHALPREALASVLWSETTTSQSKSNLRHVLWQLQTALNSQAESINDRIILVEPEWVQLNPRADLWLDIVVFEQAFAFVQKIPDRALDTSRAEVVQSAVQLYQGPLLEGWYQDWCLLERERLQNIYLAMLDKLMSYYEAHHDYETSLLYGMRIMHFDRVRERTHRQIMRLYYFLGDRAEALRQYEHCATALSEELGVVPSKQTKALYKQIQADQLDEPELPLLSPSEAPLASSIPLSSLHTMLRHIAQLEKALADLQNQMQQSAQMVEQMSQQLHTLTSSPLYEIDELKDAVETF
jgi:DNA-binding SARP family transcriptional activator